MTRPRRNIPEIIQTSAMDCGPAVLSAVLNGFHIHADYDRLREACQTDLDGTSIDVLEEILNEFQLDAEQVMLPVDHLFLETSPTAPAIFVVRQPTGLTHFVTVWKKTWRGRLQIMDPAVGRRTLSIAEFKKKLYHHRFDVPAAGWRDYAGSDDFLNPLAERLEKCGLNRSERTSLIQAACHDPSWAALAALDAAVRFAQALKKSGIVRRVDRPLLEKLIATPAADQPPLIPWSYWSVEPASTHDGEGQLTLKGAVLIKLPAQGPEPSSEATPEVQALLTDRPIRPERLIWRHLRQDGLLNPLLLLALIALAAGVTFLEALFWRGTLELANWGLSLNQQTGLLFGFLCLLIINSVLKKEKVSRVLSLAQYLELRLRTAILTRLPYTNVRYFGTRPVSDMAERNHNLYRVREIPLRGSRFLELLFLIGFSTAGLMMIIPSLAWLALLNAAVAITLPLVVQRLLQEKDLQVRTHVGALTQYYLDALRGIVPVKAHGAEQSLLREHEHLLTHWGAARWDLLEKMISYTAIQHTVGGVIAIGYIWLHRQQGLPLGQLLLAAYWLLNTVDYGQELSHIARLYPTLRNYLLRAGEMIKAEPATISTAGAAPPLSEPEFEPPRGIEICGRKMSVKIGGQTVLSDIDMDIPAGQHVAIVGPSGAGKSTLIGTLLGWHVLHDGTLTSDGHPLNDRQIERLRQETAWIDPAVQLWNRPLWDNVTYGLSDGKGIQAAEIITQAELINFLERLPNGWRTPLGEDGRLISGGEGQRVRFARGLSRKHPRLILLDEPFRGLDRPQRARLLTLARQKWAESTLLCVTHDLFEAETFDWVLFFHGGRLIQQGPPDELKKVEQGPFAHFYRQNQAVAQHIWAPDQWIQWKLNEGEVNDG
ncbi:MAG: ATP-binding cassette domain-containing protein [Ardenticatenaceae bacterium]|nr:ATP-binding cassette domain-containing protein [Ardenticatenaceae bacterium]